MSRTKSESIRNKAIKVFEKRGGMLKTSEAISEGMHPRILYELLEAGHIMQIQRGLYAVPKYVLKHTRLFRSLSDRPVAEISLYRL